MTTERKTCGTCTFCCKVMEIEELAKPQGTWCPHCRPGGGCMIYESRPPSCRAFACLWLAEPNMPGDFRPDRSKVVLDPDPDGTRLVARCDPATPVAWRNAPIYAFLKDRARATWGSSMMVMAKAGRRLWLITPTEDIDLGLVDIRSPLDIQTRPDGTAIVTVLPPAPPGEDEDAYLAKLRSPA